MRGTELETGEWVVPADVLDAWKVEVRDGWTVTIRPDAIDGDTTPLTFPVGKYTAHDYHAFLQKLLTFVVIVADVYDAHGVKLGSEEICGVAWRRPIQHAQLHPMYADVQKLLSEKERRLLVRNAVLHAIQQGAP